MHLRCSPTMGGVRFLRARTSPADWENIHRGSSCPCQTQPEDHRNRPKVHDIATESGKRLTRCHEKRPPHTHTGTESEDWVHRETRRTTFNLLRRPRSTKPLSHGVFHTVAPWFEKANSRMGGVRSNQSHVGKMPPALIISGGRRAYARIVGCFSSPQDILGSRLNVCGQKAIPRPTHIFNIAST